MRILAFSDLHCDHAAATEIVNKSTDADLVIGAGDFGIRGERTIELFDILKAIAVPLVIVPGNHDRPRELASYCATQNNMHCLHGGALEINGITIFGLGGEVPSRSDAEWNETLTEEDAAKLLQNADHYDVLLTHTPPYGYCDLQRDGSHEGSEAIASAIKRHGPSLCLCGHIHHSWGRIEQFENTTVHNLGPQVSWHNFSLAE